MSTRRVRPPWRIFLGAVLSVLAAAVLSVPIDVAVPPPPAGAQSAGSATVAGTSLEVSLSTPNGQPAFAFGVELPAGSAGNVATVQAPPGATVNPTGGPNGSPEVIFSAPVTATSFVIVGRQPWPAPLTLQPFVSLDGQSYLTLPPITASAPAPAPTTTTTTAGPPPTSPPTTRPPGAPSPGGSLTWLWSLLVGIGLLGIAGGLVYVRRLRGRKGPCGDLLDACEWARRVERQRAEDLALEERSDQIRHKERDDLARRIAEDEAELLQRRGRLAQAEAEASRYPPGPGDAQYHREAARAADDVQFWKGQVESLETSIAMLKESLERADWFIGLHDGDVARARTAWEQAQADMQAKCQAAAECLEEALESTSGQGSGQTGTTPAGGGVQIPTGAAGPCHCTFSVKLTGPEQLALACDDRRTVLPVVSTGVLTAVLDPGSGALAAQLRADARSECRGGGSIELEGATWTAERRGHDVLVTVAARARQHCPGTSPAPLSAHDTVTVKVVSENCCGPDITDGFIASVNRIYRRLAPLMSSDDFSATGFLLNWGARIIYRPYAPGRVFDDACPSPGCNDTVTIIGRCYDCFVADNLLFGIVGGYVDMSLLELEAGGWAAKLVKNPRPWAHTASEQLWRRGHAIGQRARDSETPVFDRALLAGALQDIPAHSACGPCAEKSPEPAFIDFSHEPW